MSRKRKHSNLTPYPGLPQVAGGSLPIFNKAQVRNNLRYNDYLNYFMNIAMSRFKWLNLPDSVDGRYLEYLLLLNGAAVFFHGSDEKLNGFFTTMFTSQKPLNVYDNFTQVRSYGNNGWNYDVPDNQFVIIWDSMSRIPLMQTILNFTAKLTDIDRTLDVLRKHAKMPYIITGPKELKEDMVRLWNQIDENQPAVLAVDGTFENINMDAMQTFNPALPQTLTAMTQLKQTTMNEMLEYIGISPNTPTKVQQQSLAESESQHDNINFTLLSALNARRQAAEQINRKWGLDIQVVKNSDYISDNFDMEFNRKTELLVNKGADTAGNANKNNGGRDE